MKFTAAIFLGLLVGALAYNWNSYEMECVKEQNLDIAWIEKINNPLDSSTPVDNQKLNDFLVCSWKKEYLLNDDGTINWTNILNKIKEEYNEAKDVSDEQEAAEFAVIGKALANSVDKCQALGIIGANPGETVAKNQNCVGEEFRAIRKPSQ